MTTIQDVKCAHERLGVQIHGLASLVDQTVVAIEDAERSNKRTDNEWSQKAAQLKKR